MLFVQILIISLAFIISLACVSSVTHNLQPVFLRIYDSEGGSLCQAFLAGTAAGNKNCCVYRSHACFAKKAQERLTLELFRNVSVHEFYRLKALITLEQVNTTVWSKKKIRILISKTAMVGCYR